MSKVILAAAAICASGLAARSASAEGCGGGYHGARAPVYGQPSGGHYMPHGSAGSYAPAGSYGGGGSYGTMGTGGSGGYGASTYSQRGGGAGGGYGSGNTISIRNHAYAPQTLTVTAGATVTWVNYDRDAHTATGDGFDVELAAGGRGSYTFTRAGTFDVTCRYHPKMHGRVVVQAPQAGAMSGSYGGAEQTGAYGMSGGSSGYGAPTGTYGTAGTTTYARPAGVTYGTTWGSGHMYARPHPTYSQPTHQPYSRAYPFYYGHRSGPTCRGLFR